MALFQNKYFLYLICLIPTFLVAGPALPDLTISLASLFFLYYCLTKKKYFYFKNYFFFFYIIFWLIIVLGSLYSNNIFVSLKSSFFHFRFIIFSFLIYYLIKHNDKFLKYFYNILVTTIVVVVLDGYIQFIFEKNILGYEIPYAKQRLSGFFNDEWILGSYLSKVLPLLLGTYFLNNKKTKIDIIILVLIIIFLVVLVFLSGERSAFFLTLLFLSILLIFLNISKVIKYSLIIIMVSAPIFIINSNNTYKERMFNQILISSGIMQSSVTKEDNRSLECCFFPKYLFSYGHTKHFATGIDMFKDKPLLGHGIKSFRFDCKKYEVDFGCSTHPHNTYIQVLSESGIFSFLLIMSAFLCCVILIFKNYLGKNTLLENIYNARVCFLGCIIMHLFPLIPTGSFFTNWISILYFLPVGFLLATYNFFSRYEQK